MMRKPLLKLLLAALALALAFTVSTTALGQDTSGIRGTVGSEEGERGMGRNQQESRK